MADTDLDERVKRIEQLIERAIATARQTAIGRSILGKLGLK